MSQAQASGLGGMKQSDLHTRSHVTSLPLRRDIWTGTPTGVLRAM
jgi:hypothetical protein